MKFLFGMFCCFGLMLSSELPVNAAPTDPVTIPDANLRAVIETKLGKSSGATITEAEMNGMTHQLSAGSKNIRSLTGLEHATGIDSLQLSRNRISDLSPLSGLTQLTSLDLDLNLMTELSALSNLTNLTLLYAGRPLTQANYDGPTPADLSFLTKLTQLEYLKLNVWAIRDLSILGNLTALKELYIQYNHFSDISPLGSLTALTRLDLTFNYFLTDISPLGSLTTLENLHLTSNSQISDISALKNLTNLELLWLHSTNITTEGLAEVLPSLSSLTYLILDGTRISDLSVLDRLPAGASLTNLAVRHIHDPPGAEDAKGWLLKDLTPLVELMESGKLVNQNSQSRIEVRLNWNLDYESIYTDIPALIADFSMPGVVAYSPVVPGLRRGSEEQEHHVGNPQSRHTFRVSAYSTFEDYRGNWPGNRYTAEKINEEFEGVPVTWKVTVPDGTVTETEEPVRTGDDGLSSFTITLGNDGETHTIEAIVPENMRAAAEGPSHPELKVTFTATAIAPPVITLTLDNVGYTHVQWIADVSGTLPQAYLYYFKKSADTAWIEHADLGRLPSRFSFIHFDLEPGTSYDFQLFALRGESQIEPGSNVLTASTLSRTPPGPRPPEPPPPDPPPEPPAPVNHPPIFRSASAVNVAENTTAVVTIIAEDPDADDEITEYAITGGADAALFEIGGASTPVDMLRFKDAPDFEMPGSAANSNVYTLILTATSGVGDRELTATQTLIVTVTDVDEPVVPPVQPPVEPPIEPPIEPPVDPPVEPPIEPPVDPPVEPPIDPPVELEPESFSKHDLVFTEIMFETWHSPLALPQWYELYNTTDNPIDLKGWGIQFHRNEPYLHVLIDIKESFIIDPKQAKIIATVKHARSSDQELLHTDNIYSLYEHHNDELKQDEDSQNYMHRIIVRKGFYMSLQDPSYNIIDEIGTLKDFSSTKQFWELPDCLIEGDRSSLIRRFDDNKEKPREGVERIGWIRAFDTRNKSTERWYGSPTDIGTPTYKSFDKPLPVELSQFRAKIIDSEIVISWTTEAEIDNAGFNILRSEAKNRQFVQVNNKLITGQGTTGKRTHYSWIDQTAKPNIEYYYQIEDVSYAGMRQVHATTRLRGLITAKGKMVTQWVSFK